MSIVVRQPQIRADLSRKPEETIVDSLLLLYLIKRVNEKGHLYGLTKLMKLVFLSELEMVKASIKGFNYNFYRWHLGPFTPEIYNDLDDLIENGFVTERQKIELTEEGRRLLNEINELLEKNRAILKHINKIVDRFAESDAFEIMNYVYNVKMKEPLSGAEFKVKEIPEGYPLVSRLEEVEADEVFDIDEEWIETLDIRLDKEAHESLMEALQSAKKERSVRFEKI